MISRKTQHAFRHGVLHAKFESLWEAEFEKDYPDEDVKDFANHIWLALHLSNLGTLLKTGSGYPKGVSEED